MPKPMPESTKNARSDKAKSSGGLMPTSQKKTPVVEDRVSLEPTIQKLLFEQGYQPPVTLRKRADSRQVLLVLSKPLLPNAAK
jgi:hypothetical protein